MANTMGRRLMDSAVGGTVRRASCDAFEPLGLPAVLLSLLLMLGTIGLASPAAAQMDDVDRARRMHDRLAGVPPDDVTLRRCGTSPPAIRDGPFDSSPPASTPSSACDQPLGPST